ncbi:hypothetical protein B0H21DRAFT_207664 [Amylocystis lapponica]|nr:hypothetical protein B0H21DRAFT_207664 [Amylocystis lapponica]
MQSAIPGLPPELCDLTIDFLQDDHRALKACSLASRSWLPRTRFLLFHKATIATEQKYLDILEASPEIAGFVRRLELDLSTIPLPFKDHWLHHELLRVLKTLDKVEDLSIFRWRAPKLSEDIKQDLSTIFPMALTTLRFSYVEPPLKDDLVWILRACPRLHEIEFLACQRYDGLDRPPQNIPLSETPSALVPGTAMAVIDALKWVDSDLYIVECLFQIPFTLNLQRLHTGHDCPLFRSIEFCAIYAQRLIRGAGTSLKELSVELIPHLDELEECEEYVDLSHNPNLVVLGLGGIILSGEYFQGGWDVLLRALASVRSPHLEEITIGLSIEYKSYEEDLDILDWERVDELLARLARDRPKLLVYITFDSILDQPITFEERRNMADYVDSRLPHMGTDYPDRLYSSYMYRFKYPTWSTQPDSVHSPSEDAAAVQA